MTNDEWTSAFQGGPEQRQKAEGRMQKSKRDALAFTGLGSFFHPTGVQTQGIGPDLLVKSKFTFGFVW
jgi:hypothetical protein